MMSDTRPTIFLIPTVLAPETQEAVLPAVIKQSLLQLDTFFVEELRTARRFISSLKLGISIDSLTFYQLSKDTPLQETYLQMKSLKKNAGIISEAGCPGIADPGAVAVGFAHELQYKVVPLVGPSSIFLALMASGFNGQSFVFHGYLPIDRQQRIKAIRQLEIEKNKKNQTQIFMETPYRNNQMLEDLLQNCMPETKLCIAANVTADDELIATKSIKNWRSTKPDLHKIPTIFLMG